MEHEVLFRGKDMFTGQWVEGYYFETGYGREECHYIFSGKVDTQSRYDPIYEKAQVEPATVGQYTGLTDRDGKKIFEGDIVRYSGTIHEVVFEKRNLTAYFGIVFGPNETWDFCASVPSNHMEVIGNRWDTPELLEVKK